MFSLDAHLATLAHLNTFTEKHGDEPVNGIALKMEVMAHAEVVDGLDKNLQPFMFTKNKELKFPDIGPIRWMRELVGAGVTIDGDDLLGERHVTFSDATVDKFSIEPQIGGTVHITMRVKCKPDAEEMATLYELLGKEIRLTVSPAKAKEGPMKRDQQPEEQDALIPGLVD